MIGLLLSVALAQQAPAELTMDEVLPSPPLEVSLPGPRTAELHLLVSGDTGGIGSGTWTFEAVEVLREHDVELARIDPVHGVLVNDRSLLIAEDGRVSTLVRLLQGTPSCGEPQAASWIPREHERVVWTGDTPDWLSSLVQPPKRMASAEVRRCEVDGAVADWYSIADGALQTDIEQWEFRLSLRLETEDWQGWTVGVPSRDAARRVALLQQLMTPGTVYLDAGGFVDGSSAVRDGALSLHRPTAFSALQRLDPAGLAPGNSELAGGAAALVAEAEARGLPYLATNWQADDGAPQLPTSQILELETDAGTVRVLLLAVVTPDAGVRASLASEGVSLADPVEAVEQALADDTEADLVWVLTTASPEVRMGLQAVAGVDLVLGDGSSPVTRERRVTSQLGDTALAAPVLPLGEAVEARLSLQQVPGGWSTVGMEYVNRATTLDQLADTDVRAAVTRVRAEEYPAFEEPLLDRAVTHEEWSRVVCETVREASRADLVVLGELPRGTEVPGPLTELLAIDRLAMLDTLEVHMVPGDRLMRLMLRLYGVVPNTCGADLTDKYAMARGRYLEAERLYRVATTDRARTEIGIDADLTEARSPWVLDKLTGIQELKRDGAPLTLRRTVLDTLRAMRDDEDQEDEGIVEALISRDQTEKPPMWLLRMNSLALSVEGFEGAEDDAYEEIPETLATSPSSFALGAELDAAVDYSSRGILWDARVRAQYTRLSTAGATQETADDLRLSSSATVPSLAFTTGWVGWRPYGELLYDSEFTVAEDSATPLQRDLSATVGLAAIRKGWLRTLRVGGLVLKDMSVLDKAPEFGARLEGETKVVFGPSLKWINELDAYFFADSPGQDASDLRFKVLLDSSFSLPLARWLAIELYGQGFLFAGRVPETAQVGLSYTLGARLDISGAFEI